MTEVATRRRGAATAPMIALEGISKTYRLGEVAIEALRDVSLAVGKGEFVAVMGPSGSGKSTLMNILGCLDRPTGGVYRLEGTDVSGLGKDALAGIRRTKIGFVFQGFNLIPRMSAVENVELPMIYDDVPAARRRERARFALSAVGILDRERHLPNQLSGGQQQRVAIARAIVNDPAIILADEPTGNLDSATSEEVMGIFRGLSRDRGIVLVLVTHEPDIARHAERIVRFRDGRIVGDEPVAGRLPGARTPPGGPGAPEATGRADGPRRDGEAAP